MSKIKPLAIYLPQFHSIPENDKAWGKGFTEWTNVKKAKPLFEGHYQPHVPHEDIGYYDLNDENILIKQAEIAKQYGIHGFAFYHYWFNGKRLLNMPIDNMLKSGKPDFPFCLIWANEQWTQRWDGKDDNIVMEQNYSFEDDKNHIKFLAEVFKDSRYIKIDGKPLFFVYRTELFPDIKKTTEIWRNEIKKHGFDDIYLVRVESFEFNINPADIGFDASMEFSPNWKNIGTREQINNLPNLSIYDYSNVVFNTLSKEKIKYRQFRAVFPSWDNTARRNESGTIFQNSSLEMFDFFLKKQIAFSKKENTENETFLMINAWNEWAEGCHIEPDKKNGYKILEICKKYFITLDNEEQNAENNIEKRYIEYLENKVQLKYQELEKNEKKINELQYVQKIITENKRSLSFLIKLKNNFLIRFILKFTGK